MGGAPAADRGGAAAGQDAAPRPAADGGGDHLAAPQRRDVAGGPGRTRPVVDGRAVVPPLGEVGRLAKAAAGGPGARGEARHGVPRRHHHPGAPEGGGGAEKGASPRGRDAREALGRSRGGFGTKACVVAEGGGRAVAFALAPGQARELPQARGLLDRLPEAPKWVVADRGYTSYALRAQIWEMGARPAIPAQRHEAPVACPAAIYNNRNIVEMV